MPDFHHVGLTVRDIARSYAFYTDVVGMSVWDQDAELGTKPNVDSTASASGIITVRSDAFDRLSNASGTEIKQVMLQSPDGALIFQLVEYVKGGTGELELGHSRVGSMHFSFFVDDVEAKFEELTAEPDIEVTSEIVQITPSMRSFYALDPDGVPVEFLQVTS